MNKLIVLILAAMIPMGVSAASLGVDVNATNTIDIDSGTMLVPDTSVEAVIDAAVESSQLLKINDDGVAVTSSGQVASEADLEAFTYNHMLQNPNVADINASTDDTVHVTYKHHGKLFGIFPVTVQSRTEVTTNEGMVTVATSLPWWNVFVTGTGDVADSVEAAVTESVSMQANADAHMRAQVAEQVLLVLGAQAATAVE